MEEQYPTISAEDGAHAPSECGIRSNLTTNWKSTIEVEVTINSNAWKIVGASCAPSESDSTINLRDKLGVNLLCSMGIVVGRALALSSFVFSCRCFLPASGLLYVLGPPVLEKARFQNWHCPF